MSKDNTEQYITLYDTTDEEFARKHIQNTESNLDTEPWEDKEFSHPERKIRIATTVRFKALQREIPDISQKMLTTPLRTVEEDGLVSRKVYAEVPPRVEYALTERGKSLWPHVNSLIGWAIENFNDIVEGRKRG